MSEVWKDIPQWEGYYQASNQGRIRSSERLLTRPHPVDPTKTQERVYGGKILSPKVGRGGYLYVNLWRANKGYMRAVHRLVCSAFTWDAPSALVCNHKDSNRQNNSLENLEFITQKENLDHARQLGRL